MIEEHRSHVYISKIQSYQHATRYERRHHKARSTANLKVAVCQSCQNHQTKKHNSCQNQQTKKQKAEFLAFVKYQTMLTVASRVQGSCAKTENGEKKQFDEELERKLEALTKAQQAYYDIGQQQVDEAFRAAALAANEMRVPLAKMACQETGLGIVEDKVLKNHFATEFTYHKYKDAKTVGVISENVAAGFTQVANPVGPVLGIVPVTNPTSTAIFKALICIKTRNAFMVSPPRRAKNSCAEALRVVYEAVRKVGLPEGCITHLAHPTPALAIELLKRDELKFVLATGGTGMVKACYASGKPAVGVGAGNTPVVIDETANLERCASQTFASKTFDNGTICASEQSLIVVESKAHELENIFKRSGGYFLNPEEKKKVVDKLFKDGEGHINPDVVGQSALRIAELSGITVPPTTRILLGRCTEVGPSELMSYEKLCPVLAWYTCKDFDDGLAKAKALVENQGLGHTSALYTSEQNKDRILRFENTMPTGRVLVDSPTTFGALGDVYNFALEPSLTLGCGSWGGSVTSANVGISHLLNIKSVASRRENMLCVASRRENMLWFRVPQRIFFKRGVIPEAFRTIAKLKRAFIVSDDMMVELGHVRRVVDVLRGMGFMVDRYHDVLPDPTSEQIKEGVTRMQRFGPDCVVAIGGGSVLDAAKAMKLVYEHPEMKLEEMYVRFMDIRKRIVEFPRSGSKIKSMICIPTTSGTGAEITPFVVITDSVTKKKYPIADYALTPDMAIIDCEFSKGMPKKLTAHTGLDVLTHAFESMVSILASDFTRPLSLQAIDLVFKYLPRAYKNGEHDLEAREAMHNASAIAGMAFSNAFLGICHSMAHALGSTHKVPHGLANALLLTHVVNYLATYTPSKQAFFSQYSHYHPMEDYAKIFDFLNMSLPKDLQSPGHEHMHKTHALIEAVERLKAELHIPASIKDAGVDEDDFLTSLDAMTEAAFDDQCTGASPRYPLIKEIKQLYKDAYYGELNMEGWDVTEVEHRLNFFKDIRASKERPSMLGKI
eukprot:g34309.t1